MIIPGVECDDHLPVPPLAEGDAVAVVTVLEERHHQPRQVVAAAEGVGHAVLTPRVDFSDDENIIEEENFTLVLTCNTTRLLSFALRQNTLTWSVFFVWICDLVQPAIADQSPVRQGEVGALGHDRLLDLHHLSDVVTAGPEL